jgi:predicted ArsR family transcriptional regulator
MRKLGTVDLEILQLAIKENGTFNETNLENSALKRLGVGKLLDSLASLKDRKLILLNKDGSFSITDLAKEILWSINIPTWAKILRLLQIRSCNMEQITDILRLSKEEVLENIEKLRKNQFVLMSPQRQEEKIVKIYEILPEGIEEIDKTDSDGFDKLRFKESKPGITLMGLIDEIIKEIQDSEMNQAKKEPILEKVYELKEKLEI